MYERSPSALGFVDVLIGAMSAVLLVFMAQVSQPHAKPEYGSDQASIRIALDDGIAAPRPNLAVRFRVKGGKVLDLAEARRSEPRVQLAGAEDGFTEIAIGFRGGAQFDDDEELLVYIHDLEGWPRSPGANGSLSPIKLKASLATASQPPVTWTADRQDNPLPPLTADTPAVAVKLAEICGQGKVTRVVWRLQ